MAVKVAINGFGRIGRAAFKIAYAHPDLQIVAINDLTDVRVLSYLLNYDTVYGDYDQLVSAERDGVVVVSEDVTPNYEYLEKEEGPHTDFLIVGDQRIPVFSQKDPAQLPWGEVGVDVVLECTGAFTEYAKAKAHLEAGAKKVVISAPGKGDGGKTLVFGTASLEHEIDEDIISNASCTTNCVSPVVQVMDDHLGIDRSWLTTIHSYTASQNLVDGPHHKDLRRGRAAAANITPTTTGAARAAAEAVPTLQDRFEGIAVRVPTITVSLVIVTALLKKKTTPEQLNQLFVDASAEERFKGILDTTVEPLVSSDFIGNPHSAIVDMDLTSVQGGDFVTVFAWYDNEWGYAGRLADMAAHVGALA